MADLGRHATENLMEQRPVLLGELTVQEARPRASRFLTHPGRR